MRKKLVTLLLAVSMTVTSLAGCGSQSGTAESAGQEEESSQAASTETEESDIFNAEGYPIVKENYTIKILQHLNDSNNLKEPEEITAVQMLEELTGISIEWEQVRDSDWETKLSLMFASEEYPDIILVGSKGLNKVDVEDYGVTQSLLMPLDDLIDQYMPNYSQRVAMEELDPTIPLAASDGKTYAVGYMIGNSYLTTNHFFINQKWLDKLGLETPKTPEELTEVLRAFKTQDPNGNGEADEIPIVTENSYEFLSLFGVPYGTGANGGYRWMHIDDEKQVQFVPTEEGFRACVEWLHELYEEELLDPEMFSQDFNTLASKLQNGKGGMFINYRLKNAQFMNAADECVLWTPGGDAKFVRNLSQANPAAYITSACERPEIAARLLDAMLEDEIMYSAYIGAQGDPFIGWDYNEEGKIEMYEYMDEDGMMNTWQSRGIS